MDDFSPRGAPVEYWFWRFRAGDLSFLVDFIVRQDRDAEVRVSVWVRGEGRVARVADHRATAAESGITIGERVFDRHGSRGGVDDIRWDLSWVPGGTLVDPSPPVLGRLHALDLEIRIRPFARFSGSVTVGGEAFTIDDVPGALTHYWGRRLPDRWWWISASEFEGAPDMRLEAIVLRSSLWGRGRLPLDLGYLWVSDGRGSDLTISPVTGILRSRALGGGIQIDSLNARGRRHRVRASALETSFNDLGEGIRQTLLGDLECDGSRAVAGTVGLESRPSG